MNKAKNSLTPVWAVIVIDLLILAVLLSAFCYYHHIRDIWGAVNVGSDPEVTEPPVMVITRPPRTTTSPSVNRPDDPNPPEVPQQSMAPGQTVDPDASTAPDQPEIPDPPVEPDPPMEDPGDFGALYPGVFASKGEVLQGDGYYKSHDISITVTRVEKTIEQYKFKSSTTKESTRVRYFLADIYVRNIDNLFTSYNKGSNQSFSNLLKGTNALFAASGDVFNSGAASKEVIIRNGNVIRNKTYISSDICVLYWDGTMETITPAEYNWDKILAKAPYQAWSFGPELLNDDGSVISNLKKKSSVWEVHPRSAIGYVAPGHYVFVSVHGARDTKNPTDGVNLDVLAQILSDAGCKQAYNLDGGASVYSYYNGEMLVSFGSQRKISDIICIGEIG